MRPAENADAAKADFHCSVPGCFPAIFFIRMCLASKKQRGLPGFHRKGEHEVIDPLCGRLYADTLLIFFKKQFYSTVVSFIVVEILVKAAAAVGGRIDDSCVSAVDLFGYNQKR